EKTQVEWRIVDDQFGIAQIVAQRIRYFVEPGFVGQLVEGNTVDLGGTGVDFPLRMNVQMQVIARDAPVAYFNATDFDDSMSLLRFQTRGLGIQHNLAHAQAPCCISSMPRLASVSAASLPG